MARKKLSEYKSKRIVFSTLGIPYEGRELKPGDSIEIPEGKYVLKVDQGVKGRFKKGLVALDLSPDEIIAKRRGFEELGYEFFIVERFFAHNEGQEKYLSIRRDRSGIVLAFSAHGGIDIEKHADNLVFLNALNLNDENVTPTGFSREQLEALIVMFDTQHMTLLEINPYLSIDGGIHILDTAIEVDDTGELLTSEWSETDFREPLKIRTTEEKNVQSLNKESPASFSLDLINPDGAIFLLLSGGGASVVVADEIYSSGFANQLANYGEYSGNPTEDETALYTRQVLSLLLASNAVKKVLFVGGAVANFTDIAATFKGVIKAFSEQKDELAKQGVKVFVRRGGPNQEEGLNIMTVTLEKFGLFGGVFDPSVTIPDAVQIMLKGLK